jgi:mono/diheme cytochrome c family protein
LACALIAPACDSGDEEDTEVSLSGDVLPVVVNNCGGCHTRTDAPFEDAVVNEVYLETTDDIQGLVGTFIIAGDSSQSGFMSILTQDLAVGAGPTLMPPPDLGNPMAPADVDTIAEWIDLGAKDN